MTGALICTGFVAFIFFLIWLHLGPKPEPPDPLDVDGDWQFPRGPVRLP